MRATSAGIIVLLAALAVILTAQSSHSQQFGRNKIQLKDYKWHVLTTPHFDVHFYEGEENFAARAALVLEDAYRMLSAKLHSTLPWKVPVILYSSHNDFLQTNVSLSIIQEGVQAFAEPSRKRIVLPFTGSFASFRHTAVHELAHVFTFNIVYNRLMDNVFSRGYLFSLPLWLVEGLAEYLSVGWDSDSDMFIRDAVIYDYLMDLDRVYGFYTYKQGQSVLNYIADTYGEEKVLEILRSLASTRRADAALEKTIGVDTKELSRQWKKALRKHYWPLYAYKEELDDIGRKLTDHVKDHGYYNTKPVFSPDGEKIAFFSDRDGLMDIYIMSAVDGKVTRKLVSGYRSNRFESLHAFTSSISFSPDGAKLAFVAKSQGEDVLYIISSKGGDVVEKIEIHADGLAAPDWSPLGDYIVLTAIWRGQTDLVLVNVEDGSYKRLTNDVADQLTPRFFPDGSKVIFTYCPEATVEVPRRLDGDARKILSEMDFLSPANVSHDDDYDIYVMDIESGAAHPLVTSEGDDTGPVVLEDGRTFFFTSDMTGISNLYVGDAKSSEYRRITDVLGGIFTPDVNEDKGRITFSAFVDGGWDIYVSDDLEELMDRNFGKEPSGELAFAAPVSAVPTDSNSVEPVGPFLPQETDSTILAASSTIQRGASASVSAGSVSEEASRTGKGAPRDTTIEGVDRPVEEGEVESRGATVSSYKPKLSPDFIGQGAGLYFSTGLGFGLSNTIALSDLLGNHRALFSFNFYRDIEDSDFLVSYFYLKKRIDYGFGIFQFKNFLNSRVTSIGEDFLDYRLFTERNYGMFALASIPFSTFYRMDLEFQGFVSDREFFDRLVEDPITNTLYYLPSRRSRRRLIEPTISFVHDATLYSYFGPVEGSRWIFSLAKGLAFGGEDVSRTTVFLDYRWYTRLFYRNSLAFRLALAASEGSDARSFFLGGPVTLRGYDYLAFQGTRIGLASLEYRYPMIDALILGWPTRWGLTNIGGTLFFDVGAAWEKDDVDFFKDGANGLQLEDLKADFGFGTYLNLGFLLLNFQFAWQTDLKTVGDSQFHFFLGPAF